MRSAKAGGPTRATDRYMSRHSICLGDSFQAILTSVQGPQEAPARQQRGQILFGLAWVAGHATAAKTAVLRPSPDAAEPPCPHFGPCGGCSLQGLQYGAQLAAKQAQVRPRESGSRAHIMCASLDESMVIALHCCAWSDSLLEALTSQRRQLARCR